MNEISKMKKLFFLSAAMLIGYCGCLEAQEIQYVKRFANEHHPEIGYWFISPALLPGERYIRYLDSIAEMDPYTLLFLSSREGADFYDFKLWHPVFQKIVAEAHRLGIKIGFQIWGEVKAVPLENAERMIVEDEVMLDESGGAERRIKARYIRFPDRLLKTGLFKVYAFKKTADGFYDPATLKDITDRCETAEPDKETLEVRIKGGAEVKGLTACIMTQEYIYQSSSFGADEIGRFTGSMRAYADIPFDGMALDEYGNKFVARPVELKGAPFRGRWYSPAMAKAYGQATGLSLVRTLFDGRYAPQGRPEVRMRAINEYMDFMRRGANRVENGVYKRSREIWGPQIFSGIHNTYHNSLINDEIWANGIGWWDAPRAYGQTDEKTPLPTQMGIAMAHPMNAMYNQYYDIHIPNVITKALTDLRYGIRTHYHALNDKRPNRSDLESPEAVEGINKVENCARLLNKFNPRLPEVKLLVIFGREALSNWYPNEADRGEYDINDKLGIEEKAKEIWNAGYPDALVPSDLIASHKLVLGPDGKPVMNGHRFDAILYLNPQYAREEEIKFLESFLARGGKLMIEGEATRDFMGRDITARWQSIYRKSAVRGYSVAGLPGLGIQKTLLPDGCKTEDGAYVFTDIGSLNGPGSAGFVLDLPGGGRYTGQYKGLIALSFDKAGGVRKLAAAGLTELKKGDRVLLRFDHPTDVFFTAAGKGGKLIIADAEGRTRPVVDKLDR
ncbi:MAG TPA: hypothetical protein VGM30_14345 [Puia sp.]|jgi:hypothetical protein